MGLPLSRRQFLTTLAASAAPKSRPNFLFVMADDLGYADLSCYGRRDYTTPNIDRLATEGIRFTQAYANACVCSPHPHRTHNRALATAPARWSGGTAGDVSAKR